MIQLRYGVPLITRDEWGARDPRSITGLSASRSTSHWEGPHMGVFPHSSCAAKIRGIQDFHMDARGWSDIAYNVLACPHGYAFEGRGRGVRSAANGTTAGNNGAYAVCYLGGELDGFTEPGHRAMKAAGDWLSGVGSARNCHRDWKPTACPGDIICTWTHNGQPVHWDGPAPGPTPPPTTTSAEDTPVQSLVKGDASSWYFMTDGATIRQVKGYTAADRAVNALLGQQNEINAIRAKQSLPPIQIVAARDRKAKPDDGNRLHWEPFVWPQAALDDLLRANGVVPT